MLVNVARKSQRNAAVRSGFSSAARGDDQQESEPRKFLMSAKLDNVNRERCTADSFNLDELVDAD